MAPDVLQIVHVPIIVPCVSLWCAHVTDAAKWLFLLNLNRSLNQRVLGSSPSASTIFFSKYSGLSVSQRSRRIPRRLVLAYF